MQRGGDRLEWGLWWRRVTGHNREAARGGRTASWRGSEETERPEFEGLPAWTTMGNGRVSGAGEGMS